MLCFLAPEMATPPTHETRVVIASGRPVTASHYIVDGRLLEADEHLECPAPSLAAHVAAHPWQPAPVYVVDLAWDAATGGAWVVEANCFNTASLFGCNLVEAFGAAEAAATAECPTGPPGASGAVGEMSPVRFPARRRRQKVNDFRRTRQAYIPGRIGAVRADRAPRCWAHRRRGIAPQP